MKNTRFLFITLIAGILLGMASCQNDNLNGEQWIDGYTDVVFGASIEEERPVGTRGSTRGTPGIDSVYVAHDPWNQDFYIELNTEKDGSPYTAFGVYNVPSGYEGRLEPIDPEKALNWENLDKDHTFYAWTVPWMETNPAVLDDNYDASGAAADPSTSEEDVYTPSRASIPVYFYNSSEQNGFDQNHNNAIYEGFIGAKSIPYSYAEHGKYVDLTFHHLVSKIRLESLILINSDGSVEKDLQADMTFLKIPVKATFYPHPVEGDGSGAPKGWRPYVGAPYEKSPDTGVTYYIKNRNGNEDLFYICPEIDFSYVEYQIKINTDGYENMKTYYGTFDDVVFERNTGWGYDRPGENPDNPADSKILHAGEEMRLNIVLIPGIGPGLKVIIEKWSTDKPVDSQYHSHQGFYTDAELQELLDLMYSLNAETYEDLPEEMQLLFDMYGYEDEATGKKYFPLYENVTPKKGTSTSNIFPIPPGYIIDGMGHTVTLKTNSGNYWNEGTSNYFNIGGLCRDIYFSDENGNNTIYIDKDGYVWITDENGRFVQTENKLPDEMPDGIRGFDISCRSGKIRETSYFNDRLGS